MLILCVVIFAMAQGLRLAVVSGPRTPFNVSKVLQTAVEHSGFEGSWVVRELKSSGDTLDIEADVVFDYSYMEHFSIQLRKRDESGIHFSMWPSSECASCIQYEDALPRYLVAMNFSRVLLLSDSETRNMALANSLLNNYPSLFRDISVIPPGTDYPFMLELVGRRIKSRGINLIAVFLDAVATYNLLGALDAKRMNRAGSAIILSQEAGLYRYLPLPMSGLRATGVIIMTDVGAEAKTVEDFQAAILQNQLMLLKGVYEVGNVDFSQFVRRPEVMLAYMNNSRIYIAARTPSEVTSKTLITFPGNTTNFPKLQKAVIKATVNYDVMNPDNTIYALGPPLMRGFKVAFEEANNRTDLIPDYYLEDASVAFTGVAFSYNYTKPRVAAAKKDLGLIYMMVPSTQSIIGMTRILRELNVTLPLAAGSLGQMLSDPKTYPLYIRPRVANRYLFTIVARLLRYFGWTHVAVLYAADQGDYEDGYNQFLLVKDIFGINITNSEERRVMPVVLNNQTTDVLVAALTEILASDTRIILVLHRYHFVIMEQLYDMGVREEYVQVYVSGLNDAVFLDPAYIKRRVVSKGALLFFPRLFVGKVGEYVEKELIKRDGSGMYPNSCFFYDVAYLYFYATQFLLERGLDYEDPYLIVKSMRESYFHGCSGFIKIDSGSNDRAASEIAITNFQYNSENDTYVLKVVGGYNPFSTQPYQITSPLQWPDDGETYADLKPRYKNCPYLEEVVTDVKKGRSIGIAVDFVVAFATLIVTLVIWKKWWDVKHEMLKIKEKIAMEDVLVLVTVCCDYFQFAAVGPDLSRFSGFISSITASFGFNMEAFLSITNGVYWVVLDVVLALVVVWTVICVLKFTGTDSKIGLYCSSFEYWTDMLMPTLGNLLFLPIVSTLTNVFLCYRGTSGDLKESFLNKDCYERCWEGDHLGYAIGASLGLVCYIPLAIFTRPLWQDLQVNVHVKSHPLALMVKSAVQVFLIVTSNTLKQDSPNTHAYIYFAVIVCYIAFMAKTRQFNYDRLNLWQVIVMVAMLSLSVAGFIAAQYPVEAVDWFLLALGGEYAALGAVGVTAQCLVRQFESKLTREKGRDVRGLFTFAFTTGVRAREGLDQFYTANSITIRRPSTKTNSDGQPTKQVE